MIFYGVYHTRFLVAVVILASLISPTYALDRYKVGAQVSVFGKVTKWVSPFDKAEYLGGEYRPIFKRIFEEVAADFEQISGNNISVLNVNESKDRVGIIVISYQDYDDFLDNTQNYFGEYYKKYGLIVDGNENEEGYALCSGYKGTKLDNSYANLAGVMVVKEGMGEKYFRECLFHIFYYFMGITYRDGFERLISKEAVEAGKLSKLSVIEVKLLEAIYRDDIEPGILVENFLDNYVE